MKVLFEVIVRPILHFPPAARFGAVVAMAILARLFCVGSSGSSFFTAARKVMTELGVWVMGVSLILIEGTLEVNDGSDDEPWSIVNCKHEAELVRYTDTCETSEQVTMNKMHLKF